MNNQNYRHFGNFWLKVVKCYNHNVYIDSDKAQTQTLDNIADASSISKISDSGIYTINSEMMPGNNICQTPSNQCKSSQTVFENSSSNQDNHLNDDSNPCYSRASSPGRCSPKDSNNNSLRF